MPGGAHDNMKAWDPEEDDIIMSMHAKEGPKWKKIVEHLPGRTVSSVRNRWQRIEKGRKLREDGAELKNRCHSCGEPKRGHICRAKARGGPQVEIPTPFNMPAQVTVPGDATALAIPMPVPLQGGWLGGGLPSGGPSLAGQWMQLPPPPMSAGVASRNPGQVALKRTRSGSRLVPSEEPAQPSAPPALSVNVGVAINHNDVAAAAAARRGGGGAPPRLQRSDTSFLRDLANSDIFSPGSRGFFELWADSPRDAPAPVQNIAADDTAPPALRRAASGENIVKLTRSVSSYVRGQMGEGPATGAAGGVVASSTSPLVPDNGGMRAPAAHSALSRQPSLSALSRQPSLSRVSRQPSVPGLGRGVSSFLRDFMDESAALDSAPPPDAIPPSLRLANSMDPGADGASLMPPPLSANMDSFNVDSFFSNHGTASGPPTLSRRSSPRVAGIARQQSFGLGLS